MRHDWRRLWREAVAATAGLLCCGFAVAKVPCGYDVEIVAFDCGGIFGPTPTEGFGIAPNGVVVGSFWDCVVGPPFYHAFLWPPSGGMQVLPFPRDVVSMELLDANDNGQAVGVYQATGNSPLDELAFLVQGGRFTSLGTVRGGTYSKAWAINAVGTIAGVIGNNAVVPLRAAIWKDARLIEIWPDLGTPQSEALDVNVHDQVTGWMGQADFLDSRAYVWNASRVVELPLLPEPGAYSTTGRAINDFGNVCGWGIVPMPGVDHGIAYAFIDGKAMSLGTLPGFQGSRANDINNLNQVVGYCHVGGPFTAVLWEEGAIYRLSDLIDPKLDLHIAEANAITDSGIIAGTAEEVTGNVYAVRLIPRTQADLDCDGGVGGLDLGLLLGQWGACPKDARCPADLNSDDVVNGFDLALLLGRWG